jgi:hypothetical protein
MKTFNYNLPLSKMERYGKTAWLKQSGNSKHQVPDEYAESLFGRATKFVKDRDCMQDFAKGKATIPPIFNVP